MPKVSNYSAQDEAVEFFKNKKDILNITINEKENNNDIKNKIEEKFKKQTKILSGLIKNKSMKQFENEYLNHF